MSNINQTTVKEKFLICIEPTNKKLFILHRNYPSCLIEITNDFPTRFIVQDLYDDMDNPNDILNMPFVQEAKEFYKTHATKALNLNKN